MSRREIKLGSKDSILDEMYGNDPAPQTPVVPVADPSATRGGHVSNTTETAVQQGQDTGRTRRGSGSNRVPAGKVKQTFYLEQDVVDELNATVERLSRDLRGLVPRHAVLAALLRAGIAQSERVRTNLRQELIQGLDADG